ncbi:MAG: hypothetical protein ACI4B3_07625 [Prevotella sp.]
MVTYDKYIIEVLVKMGSKGISLRNLVKSVYNLSNTFFFSPDYDDVYRHVQQYVLRNSKTPSSFLERMDTRGYYRLNKLSKEAEQLMIEFEDNSSSESYC